MKRLFLCVILCTTALFLGCEEEPEVPVFGDVYGIVTDSQTGAAISNAQVELSPDNRTVVTGSDGRYEFKTLEAHQYEITVTADGYEANTRQVTVIPGQSVTCDIHLQKRVANNYISLDHTELQFGSSQSQLSIVITNAGEETTDWAIDLASNTWLTASPKSGRIEAGKSQTIIFTANRANIKEEVSGVISISAFGNSTPIAVSCSPSQQASSVMEIEPLDVDFGTQSTEQTIRIKNTGTSTLEWSIYGLNEPSLSITETNGTIEPNNSTIVAISLDRSMVSENIATTFIVSDGANEQTVNVIVLTEVTSEEEEPEEEPLGAIEVSTTSLDFGAKATPLTFTITNVGEGAAEWEIIDIQPANVIGCDPAFGVLEAGEQATVNVTINMEAIEAVSFEGSFAVSDGINKYGVTVTATNPAYDISDGVIELSTTELDFNDDKSSLTFDLTNTGSTYLAWTATGVPSYINFNSGKLNHKQSNGSTETITVTLDRLAMPDEVDTCIVITNDYNAEDSHKLRVLASKVNSKIYYTAVDNKAITIYKENVLGEIISHTYADGQGVITVRGVLDRIGNEAFANCTTIGSMTIPEGVTSIGKNAFYKCINMAKIDMPSTVDYIGDNAFQECLALDNVVIPDGVTVINPGTFYKCTSLTNITIPNSVVRIGEENGWLEQQGVFRECTALTTITLPNSVTAIGYYTFYGCSNLTTVTLPNKLEHIYISAFENCTSLQEVTLPNSLISIESAAFKNCSSLTHITIPASVTIIPSYFCSACTNLATVTIPEGITEIQHGAFDNTQLTTVTIPSTVTSIGELAFSTESLLNVYCKPTVPPQVRGSGWYQSFDIQDNLKIYVPTYSVYLYQTAEGWSSYTDYIVGYDF